MIYEKLVVPRLEIHVSDYCNLKCDNCNHFSNYGIKGSITSEEYEVWNRPWAKRLAPLNYQLLGGEPTVNPELVKICRLAREIWRDGTQILLVTNGWFLQNHPELPAVLADLRIKLIVSIHDDSERYNQKFHEIKLLIDSWLVKWQFECHYRESYKNWLRTFKRDDEGNTVPFADDNPIMSFANCMSKDAKQIYEGNLYKCPPLAYLNLIKKKFPLSSQWDFFLGYKPLTPNCSRKELDEFFAKKAEAYCNMCASNPEEYKKNDSLVQLVKKF